MIEGLLGRKLGMTQIFNEQGETVALDLTITPELRRAGLARDVIRLIQETRKSSGLEVSDRISLSWSAQGEVRDAVQEHAGLIADEVLATSMQLADASDSLRCDDPELGFRFDLTRVGG